MVRLALAGADDGALGTEVLDRASARGDEVVALRADAGHGDGGEPPAGATSVRSLDLTDPASVGAAVRGVDVVVSCLTGQRSTALRRAAVRHGIPLVDADGDLAGFRAAREELDGPARAAGLPVVLGVGWRTALGDLLTAVAARRLPHVTDVHVAYTIPDRGGVVAAAAPGGREGLARHLPGPTVARVRGAQVEEQLGEHRRLAWFPRPLGPHHAASAPGLEPLWVPDHLDVGTVRTYVAASSLRAEALQAAGNLARWEPSRRRVLGWLGRPGVPQTAETRWACVAEVAAGDGPVRGWANGRDPQGTTAALLLALADAALHAPPREGGVLAPARLATPDATLDVLAGAGQLRWSVTDPNR